MSRRLGPDANKVAAFTALLFAALSLHLAFTGCGSESSNADPNAAADADTDGMNCDPATGICTPVGTSSSGSTSGSSGNPIACAPPDAACTTNSACCTFACVSSKCSGKQCIADNAACTTDGECCGAKCTTGKCAPLSNKCKTLGNTCGDNKECCSNRCNGGICAAPSFCTQDGDACGGDIDCCGGVCTKTAGATLGLCNGVVAASGVGNCTPAGVVCGSATTGGVSGTLPNCGGECCSRSCRPYAPTGSIVCQPPSGCHPTGELCQTDVDCCGSPGSPGSTNNNGGMQTTDVHCSKKDATATLGRCDNGKACSPAGAICRLATNSCNATDKCCSGNVQQHPLNCKQDSLGIPRCTAVSDYDCAAQGPPPAGTACATSADCCNRPCVPNPAGGTPALVCSGVACVPVAGACTTTADCCAGSPCTIPAGATKGACGPSGKTPGPDAGGSTSSSSGSTSSSSSSSGGSTTCAQYGQQCTVAGDCCDNVPCTGGFCIFPGPN